MKQRSKKFSSAFKGVTYHIRRKEFRAQITVAGKQIFLGGFKTELKAAAVYRAATERSNKNPS